MRLEEKPMNTRRSPRALLVLLLAAAFAAGPALAEKPERAGGGKDRGKPHKEARGNTSKGDARGAKGDKQDRQEVRVGAYFSDEHRRAARGYYSQHYGAGKACPPGLAKKNNGCLPPGQAKKWAVGQALPAGITLYPVPQPVLVYLPPAPAGHRYVRVAGDILLIAVGTQMVVDGISDLLRL
jgi:Ni/Co efflux regulator RcnB